LNIGLFAFFGVIILLIAIFCIYIIKKGQISLIHILYFIISGISAVWLMALMSLLFFKGNATAEYIIDAITNTGVFLSVLILLVSLVFFLHWDRLPRWCLLLFIMPVFSFIMVWTNPLHHLHYEVFSLDMREIKFGPLVTISGLYGYCCVMASIVIIIYFYVKSKRSIQRRQALFLAAGNVISISGSMLTTLNVFDFNLYTIPLFYIFGIVLMHGYAILKFHMLDIKPIAVEMVLNRLSDCYLVVSSEGIIVNLNKTFADTFGAVYGLSINANIYDSVINGKYNDDVGMHTLLSSIRNSQDSDTTISYEQSLMVSSEGKFITKFYMVDVTRLNIGNQTVGSVVFFKDISKLKNSMRDLQNSQKRLMESERLVFLGNMLGGISHNLKTPIMSISGSIEAVSRLIEESAASLYDQDVTKEDYMEIYAEMNKWIARVREACAYMSDIITAVKGQAANLNANDDNEFTIEDTIKRTKLLLRHEIQSSNCTLKETHLSKEPVKIYGDINSLVQVLNNLIDNAIYAMKETGGIIEIETEKDEETFFIRVKDQGCGIPDDVKERLFSQMVTSKGAMGNGLGLFISNSFIKARFDGSIWFEDNPEGGTIFIISLPLKNIRSNTEKPN